MKNVKFNMAAFYSCCVVKENNLFAEIIQYIFTKKNHWNKMSIKRRHTTKILHVFQTVNLKTV